MLSQKSRNQDASETNDGPDGSTGVGLEFGGSIIFVPGQIKGDSLRINNLGFAFSTGFIASFVNSDRYGAIYNILGKAGVEIGNQHLFGFGGDILAGYGKLPGDIIFCEDGASVISNNSNPYTKGAFVYGGQVWVKAGLSKVLEV